ncbi:MAG: HAD hydrolase-like protein [Spirochaetes bacterium]|nr:HAD hydrolase-like protein [Spirochaetota bacterium]
MNSERLVLDLMRRYSRALGPEGLSPMPTAERARGFLRGPVEAVLFDVYGTLFVSGSGDIGEAKEGVRPDRLTGLLSSYGVSLSPDRVIHSFFDEIRRVHECEKKRGVDYPEVLIEAVWMAVLGIEDRSKARRFACEYEMTVNPVWPMPRLETLLERVRERGIALGIVSNAQFFTPLLFELFIGESMHDLGFSEELTVFSYREGRAKPSPLLFEKAGRAVEARGIARSATLYVGNDMLNDISPAYDAGFQTALFAGDRRSLRLRKDDVRLRDVAPDLVVTNLMELSEHIGKG